jgi:hypothetical protein
MANRLFVLGAAFLLISMILHAGPVKDGSLSAHSDGVRIYVRWISEDESGVARFEVERKAGLNGQFILLAQVAPRGNNSPYEYVDDSPFRVTESIYQYRVKVVMASGEVMYFGPVTVPHNPSTVRRTWGSIKAMFR